MQRRKNDQDLGVASVVASSSPHKSPSVVSSAGSPSSAINEPLMDDGKAQTTPCSHRILPFCLLAQTFIALFELFLGGMWAHVMGSFAAVLSLVLAVCTFVVSYVDRYRPPARWMRGLLLFFNFLVAGYVFLLFAVHFMGPDRIALTFPSSCHRTSNCVRLTPNVTSNVDASDLQPLTVATSANQVTNELQRYLLALPRTAMIGSSSGSHPVTGLPFQFYQFRTVSLFMGFPDDSYFLVQCNGDRLTELWIQAEARIGVSDFGVNKERIVGLLNDFNNVVLFKRESCSAKVL